VSEFLRHTARKVGRPRGALGQTALAIRDEVESLTEEYDQMAVRQAYYALTVRGVVEKTEAAYRQVQRQILSMRREGILPWSFIADGTRWQRKPETWDDVNDALNQVKRTYRRNLWRSQHIRVEVWLEKDALASIVSEVTELWDVSLMVSRGQSSDTFIWNAAQAANEAWSRTSRDPVPTTTQIFALYDADRSGRVAADKVREKLQLHSLGPIYFALLAVTDEQIEEWHLPTRPAKENADEVAVELDAVPPKQLVELVDDAISGLVDKAAWRIEKQIEESEREILSRLRA
jgi:hypothetical protein